MSTAAAAADPSAGNPGTTTTQVAPTQVPDDFDPMAAAMEADREMDAGREAETSATDTATAGKPDATKPNATPGEQGAQKTQANAKPGEQGAELSKEEKERQRQENALKGFQREKDAFRAEKQAILAEREALRRELAELRQTRAKAPATDEHGVTADTYDRLAQKLEDEGDEAGAREARQRAGKLREQQAAARAPEQPMGWNSPQFQQEWQRHTAELIADDPELEDPNNPVVKAANALLSDKQWAPYFTARPDGIRAAVEVAKLVRKSHEIDTVREELTKAKAEVERLTKLTQPRGGHPAGHPQKPEKSVDELTEDDVLRIARDADRGG